ncbi:MAG TPA: anaerobic ribonucleoside-triphosphate reductase activating protein [Methanomassiliicoccales archaeon]|jgi:pyruvate formate lyase activating enzyme
MALRIVGFSKTSLLDWDGHVVATIYLQGCNWRCLYCHNPDLVPIEPVFDELDFEDIAEYVRDNADFLDGVAISGGEPTIHPDLPILIAKIRDLGMKVKLDTNGSNPEMLEDLLGSGMLDYVAMDIKAPLNGKYKEIVKVNADLEAVKRSILLLMNSGTDYEFRTTIVPFLLEEKEVEAIAAYIGGSKKFALHQFKNDSTLEKKMELVSPYPEEKLRAMADIAKRYVGKVVIRGTS